MNNQERETIGEWIFKIAIFDYGLIVILTCVRLLK